QIQFTAYGANSFNINGWGLDNIVVNGSGSLIYTWSVTSGTGGLSSTSGNPTTATNLTSTTQYGVSVSDGTCTSTSSVTVTVADTTFSGLNPDFCDGDGAVFLTPNTPGGTFSGTGVSPYQGGAVFDPAASGIGTFVITYTLPYGCHSSQTTTVHPIPTV